jgi:DNA (cytosine-5)-methyltransferase 1
MTYGSLFSGIGGLDLGLDRAGLRCAWQCEIDDYARRVLARHWPDVRRWDDVRTFPPVADAEQDGRNEPAFAGGVQESEEEGRLLQPQGRADSWHVDLICGGFPCQDISYAGKGAGLAGERSGLWYEFARVVRVLRPRYVLVENVAALLVRGLDAVLGTLASLGYDAEWACLPAAAVGAPHIRDRVFIVAHAAGQRDPERKKRARRVGFDKPSVSSLPHPDLAGLAFGRCFGGDARQELAAFERANRQTGGQWRSDPADEPQSSVGRVAHGVPRRVDRLRGLGNAVVPQVAEFIGRRILAHAASQEVAA